MLFHLAVLLSAILIIVCAMLPGGRISFTNGGIAMAFGITGVFYVNYFSVSGQAAAVVSLVLMFSLIARYAADAIQDRTVFTDLFEGSLSSLTSGTWIAGISVSAVSIYNGLPDLRFLLTPLYFINLVFWLFYLFIYVRFCLKGLQKEAHGIVLLGCVATQSLVITGKTLFADQFPDSYAIALLMAGIFLYVIGIIYLAAAGFTNKSYSLSTHWKTTNCMIHGGLSNTGIAMLKTPAVSPHFSALLWIGIIVLFIAVEAVELIRARSRIRKFGWKEGLFTYQPDQWSRIFTFGMFFFLTFTLSSAETFIQTEPVLALTADWIQRIGIYFLVLLITAQTLLFFLHNKSQALMSRKD